MEPAERGDFSPGAAHVLQLLLIIQQSACVWHGDIPCCTCSACMEAWGMGSMHVIRLSLLICWTMGTSAQDLFMRNSDDGLYCCQGAEMSGGMFAQYASQPLTDLHDWQQPRLPP